ncbi:MAG: GNAT family N-acetyltransferase [Rhodobacteraceae bacterium]|nr:GNAT family N-acetyltransferase [Paracoccaceae bacterium]
MTATIAVTSDLGACRALRRAVFIDEQGIAEADEIDDLDDAAIHLLAMDQGRPVGTARLLIDGAVGRIGRVCVLPTHRGTGLGAALMAAAIAELSARPGLTVIRLSAQLSVERFYQRLGFAGTGPVYDDAGIPHRTMERAV